MRNIFLVLSARNAKDCTVFRALCQVRAIIEVHIFYLIMSISKSGSNILHSSFDRRLTNDYLTLETIILLTEYLAAHGVNKKKVLNKNSRAKRLASKRVSVT